MKYAPICAILFALLLVSCKFLPEQTAPVREPVEAPQEQGQEPELTNAVVVSNYEECVAAGNAILESMPVMCVTDDGTVFVQESPDPSTWEQAVGTPGLYVSYVDGAIGNGMESVLFFHAAWCPYCIANDRRLQAWYGAEKFPRSVYKVDYDTATELKALFGVTNQDTFIVIDGNGNEISRVTFPSEEALRGLLGDMAEMR